MTTDELKPCIIVLDGGMGRELLRIGAPFRQPEWSALALMEAPDRVLEAHRNFIGAGAEVITANTYAVVPFHIGPDRFAEEGRHLVDVAVRLARQAADEADRSIRVAGSLAPLFGSYEPDKFRADAAQALYQPIVEAQVAHVDLWIIETMSSVAEAMAAITAIRSAEEADEGRRAPIWLAFCLPDEIASGDPVLRSGEPVSALVHDVGDEVDAFLINCSRPESIGAALSHLRDLVSQDVPIGAYANTFAPEPVRLAANSGISKQREELTPEIYADAVDGWIELGATIVGGCCGIYPSHISELARRHHGL